MGVMACNVLNCENVMCDRYNSKHGYICYSCFDRLLKLGVQTNLEEFFSTPPPAWEDDNAKQKYFDALFPASED